MATQRVAHQDLPKTRGGGGSRTRTLEGGSSHRSRFSWLPASAPEPCPSTTAWSQAIKLSAGALCSLEAGSQVGGGPGDMPSRPPAPGLALSGLRALLGGSRHWWPSDEIVLCHSGCGTCPFYPTRLRRPLGGGHGAGLGTSQEAACSGPPLAWSIREGGCPGPGGHPGRSGLQGSRPNRH